MVKQTMLRKKGERGQKAQNEQLAAILSATPLGIFQTRNGVILWVNRQLTLMLGYEESQIIGKEVRVLAKSPDELDQVFRESCRSSRPFRDSATPSATSPGKTVPRWHAGYRSR